MWHARKARAGVMRCLGATQLLGVTLCLAWPTPVLAQPVRAHVLRGIEIHEGRDAFELRAHFAFPVRYLRHTPERRGETIRIQVRPLVVGALDQPWVFLRESLRAPNAPGSPVRDLLWDGRGIDGPILEVRFLRRADFEVRQGEDLRSITVRIRKRELLGPPAPLEDHSAPAIEPRSSAIAESSAQPPTSEQLALSEELAREIRSAITAGDSERAVGLCTRLLALPENPHSRTAKEYLGLARERNGQRAHAKAEYEAYLERYPEGEGTGRVRQRLAALLTARDAPPEPLRQGRALDPGLDLTTFGSVSLWYRRDERFRDGVDETTNDSTLVSDLFLVTRLRNERWNLTSEFSGAYGFDFLGHGSSNDTRISTAFLEAARNDGSFFGSLGRQSRSTGGVLGRFDGATIGTRLGSRARLTAVAGLPVGFFDTDRINTDRRFVGLSLDLERVLENLDLQLYAIAQDAHGVTDRRAVGLEFRYADREKFLAGFLDYDLHFGSLNTALLVGNWQITRDTSINWLLDRRNSPILTSSNALQGQLVKTLGDLEELFPSDSIGELAKDRTARSSLMTVGSTHRLDDRLQISGDVSLSRFSSTKESGGIEETEGTGWEVTTFAQLIRSDLWRRGDTGLLGIRWIHGGRLDSYALILDSRIPFGNSLRVGPGLRIEYRDQDGGPDVIVITPGLRLDYRLGSFTIDVELAFDWVSNHRVDDLADEVGYRALLGIRYDF